MQCLVGASTLEVLDSTLGGFPPSGDRVGERGARTWEGRMATALGARPPPVPVPGGKEEFQG